MPLSSSSRYLLGLSLLLSGTAGADFRPEPGRDWWDELEPAHFPAPGSEVSEVIDRQIEQDLKRKGIQPVARADDSTLLRRMTLDLAGRIPTVAEQTAFAADRDPDRWKNWVDLMLASPSFERNLAHEMNWLLMEQASPQFEEFLLKSIREDIRWDEVFGSVVRAQGATGSEQFLRTRVRDRDKMANDLSMKFFGVNISCAQCHDHPYVASWTQATYYGTRAFFDRTFDNGGFVAERSYGTISYKTVDGEERVAPLQFLGGSPLSEPSRPEPDDEAKKADNKLFADYKKKKQAPPPPDYSRRSRVIEAGLSDPYQAYFARSLVNQTWNRLMGTGLVMPLDQMHGQNAPSHPELLEWLAQDLMAHSYDLRRLLQGIVLSRAYQRDSRWTREQPRPPGNVYAVAPLRPLSPRQYGISLKLGATDPHRFAGHSSLESWASLLESIEKSGASLGNRLDRPTGQFQVSVDEALDFSNDPNLEQQLLNAGLIAALQRETSLLEKVELSFRAVSCRAPSPEEQISLQNYLEARSQDPENALRQMVWALMMSSENRFNH